jgi:hypothetical protein
MELYNGFRTQTDPATGRKLIQLTNGDAFCYPLYYFIPSITDDGRYLVYHRCEGDGSGVQLWSLELGTGVHKQLTHAENPAEETQWKP